MVRIGCYGLWHVHGKDFANKLLQIPQCRLVAVGSRNRQDGEAWAAEMQCRFIDDFGEMVSATDIDAIMITDATALHGDMIVAAANAGKHVFVEKALAVSNEDADRILHAVQEAGICFTMSDPVMRAPQVFAKELVDSGKLGQVTLVRVRATHDQGFLGTHLAAFYNVAESGGGAVIDMGCKAVHLLYRFLGRPQTVTAMCSHYTEQSKRTGAEENAVAIYRFADGALGVIEASWLAPKYQASLEVCGTSGCVHIFDDKVMYRITGGDWIQVQPDQLPSPLVYPLNDWIDSIVSGHSHTQYDVEEAVCLTEMVTAAYRAAGQEISL